MGLFRLVAFCSFIADVKSLDSELLIFLSSKHDTKNEPNAQLALIRPTHKKLSSINSSRRPATSGADPLETPVKIS